MPRAEPKNSTCRGKERAFPLASSSRPPGSCRWVCNPAYPLRTTKANRNPESHVLLLRSDPAPSAIRGKEGGDLVTGSQTALLPGGGSAQNPQRAFLAHQLTSRCDRSEPGHGATSSAASANAAKWRSSMAPSRTVRGERRVGPFDVSPHDSQQQQQFGMGEDAGVDGGTVHVSPVPARARGGSSTWNLVQPGQISRTGSQRVKSGVNSPDFKYGAFPRAREPTRFGVWLLIAVPAQ
jgi:hypothetical protein